MGFMGPRFQEHLLTSVNLTIYIHCSLRKGNQNAFGIALTLYSLHYFTDICVLHIYIYIYKVYIQYKVKVKR
jgi:hypothetical protein